MRLTVAGLFVYSSLCLAGSSYTESWKSTPAQLTGDLSSYVDTNKGELYLNGAESILRMTLGCNLDTTSRKPKTTLKKKSKLTSGTCAAGGGTDHWDEIGDSYFVIHVLRWKDVSVDPTDSNKAAPAIDSQRWYVYHNQKLWTDEDFTKAKRIFGKHRVWFLYLHLNKPARLAYSAVYTVQTTQKTPAYLDHLMQLAGLFGMKSVPAGGGAATTITVFGGQEFEIPYVPSDIKFTPQFTLATPTPAVPPAKPYDFGAPGTPVSGLVPETFDNEGKYWIDFSVAVPFNKISQLQYNNTNNTIIAAKVDQQNIFGLLNVYFRPIDIKGTGFSKWPHLVAGVAIDSNPLKKALVGVGYGPALANIYVGAALVTDRAPSGVDCGQKPPTSQAQVALPYRTCAQFSVGLNVGVGAVVSALKSTKK